MTTKTPDISTQENQQSRLDEMLFEFACGSLPAAESLMLSVHTSLNETAHNEFSFYQDIGGGLVERLTPSELSEQCLENVLKALDHPDEEHEDDLSLVGDLPPALARLTNCTTFSDLKWEKLFKGIDVIDLSVEDTSAKVRLMRFEPGFVAPKHSHHEFEMTVILDGAYTDEFGTYKRGDISIVEEHEGIHQPKACPKDGCVCLVSTFAPLKFKNPLHKLLNRFMKF